MSGPSDVNDPGGSSVICVPHTLSTAQRNKMLVVRETFGKALAVAKVARPPTEV